MAIKRSVFVLTAEMAARLHRITVVAKRISLVANNAREITVRAGNNATKFLDWFENLDVGSAIPHTDTKTGQDQ